MNKNDDVGGAFAEWIVGIMVVVAVIIIMAIVAALMEAFRIYRTYALRPTEIARWLWICLGIFVVLLVLSIVLMSVPQTLDEGLVLLTWAFCGWLMAIEVLEMKALRATHEDYLSWDDYVDPFAAPNGGTATPLPAG